MNTVTLKARIDATVIAPEGFKVIDIIDRGTFLMHGLKVPADRQREVAEVLAGIGHRRLVDYGIDQCLQQHEVVALADAKLCGFSRPGFYANDVETFFVTEASTTFIIYSADDLGTEEPVKIDSLPEDATAIPASPDLVARVEKLTDALAKVVEQAKLDAAAFVAEFNEPIDPSATDWDATAWGEVKIEGSEQFWDDYQAALVAETQRLCEG